MKILEQKELLARRENDFLHLTAHLTRRQSLPDGREPDDADYLKKRSEAEALGKSVFDMKLDALRSVAVGTKIKRALQETKQQNIRPLSEKDFLALEEFVHTLFPTIYELFLGKLKDATATYRNMFLLSFFDLPTKTEGCLLNISDDLARKQRSRLRKKLGAQGSKLSILAFIENMYASIENGNGQS
jgi:hypothetical protein